MKGVRVLVCGDRHWTDKGLIQYYLTRTLKSMDLYPTVIIEGGAKGADTLAKEVAEYLGYPVEEYKAQWDRYGNAAGMIRNRQMLVVGKPDVVIAFHDDLEHNSKGTKGMVEITRKQGKAILLLVSHNKKE